MTNYHPDVQRAYESHCADGYVVPDDETGPQEATGATESDESRVQALGDGAGLREAVEALAKGWEHQARINAAVKGESQRPMDYGEGHFDGVTRAIRVGADNLRAVLAVHPASRDDFRAELDNALADLTEAQDDLTRTLARAEKSEAALTGRADVAADLLRDTYNDEGGRIVLRQLGRVKAERDRARDTAAALEAEVARLSGQVERGEALREAVAKLAERLETEPCHEVPFLQISAADYRDGWERAQTEDARQLRHILAAHPAPTGDYRDALALSDTTGEATSETRAGAGVYGRLPGRLCDPDGWVRSGDWHHGTDYQCTGSAHLGSTEIVCTNPVHDQPDTTGEAS